MGALGKYSLPAALVGAVDEEALKGVPVDLAVAASSPAAGRGEEALMGRHFDAGSCFLGQEGAL